jgi:tripartite-type tricarboxylate transporter receptor subunit TctC
MQSFKFHRRGFFSIAIASALSQLMVPMQAKAQDAAASYPNKPITMIVPYAAGGSSDARARQIAQKISEYLGQSVVVDNKSGGSGNIGTNAIAKAAPDGYTIGIGNFGPLTVNKSLIPSTPYNPRTDLTPIIMLEKGPVLLLVNAEKSPHKDLKSFVAALKDAKGKMSYGSSGAGGVYHLTGELFKSTVGAYAVHIPYRSGGQMLNDLIAGQVDFAFDMAPSSMGFLKVSPPKMRALAVGSDKRLTSLPDVPTFAELGYKGMEISNWFGIVAPKGTPESIVNKLNSAINKALQDPEMAQRITGPGNIIAGGSAKAFSDHINAETDRWTKLIKDNNIKAD